LQRLIISLNAKVTKNEPKNRYMASHSPTPAIWHTIITMTTKNIVLIVIIILVLGLAGFFISKIANTNTAKNPNEETPITQTATTTPTEVVATTSAEEIRGPETIIGSSVNGADITAYHFGTGDKELLFIGGVHGGYSWNTALVAYDLIDYLKANPTVAPEDVTVTIIPVANPDGLKEALGTTSRFETKTALSLSESIRVASRFNSHDVDLNRNFDCEWKATGTWRSQTVSGGSAPFSEPEAAAIRDYVEKNKPTAAVVWFSAEGKVYPSACGGKPSAESTTLASTYAKGAGYATDEVFDAYAITGDMVNWFAKQNIPAISVLLTDHKSAEWEKNKAGFEAMLATYEN